MKRILCVAEKPSAAKKIAGILSKGAMSLGLSRSKFNPVYEFNYKFQGQEALMNFTSVAGHIIGLAFEEKYSKKYWGTAPYEHLFTTAKINRVIAPDKQDLANNIKELAKSSNDVILWLDCDREGEAIAFEVLRICQESQPKIGVYRAHFSALTSEDIDNAMQNLKDPDPNLSAAVESRSEIDLRIGAAFTRFQTNLLKKNIASLAAKKVISYGPCQFPTLGFIVERWRKVLGFVPEPFWYISCKHEKIDVTGKKETVTFSWDRDNQFDKEAAKQLFKKCEQDAEATVISVVESQRQKLRPVPLSTVAMQKLATSKLRLSSHKVMEVAEKLYNKGFISYPRTDTDIFPQTMNLKALVQTQTKHPIWGQYASELLAKGKFEWPRNGKRDDKAHPPIHPVRLAQEIQNEFTPEEWQVYELVTRHFLASCSKDAKGFETVVNIQINEEAFHAKGLVIKEHNWLEIYPYDKWSGNVLPDFKKGETFVPKELKLKESKTSPPSFLTEQELINLMDQNGIGTDATIHEHIQTIQEREYVEKEGLYFKPTKLGAALIDSYEATGTDLWKPYLRASMESSMTEIANGKLKKEDFLKSCLNEMLKIFIQVKEKENILLETVNKVLGKDMENKGVKASSNNLSRIKCYKCGKLGHYATFCKQLNFSTRNVFETSKFKQDPTKRWGLQPKEPEAAKTPKSVTEQKICAVCGHIGRHPKGSTCSAVKRKALKKDEA